MDADVFADLSRHVDREFYRHHYPDIARAGLDPVPHWHRAGWVERRRPNVWFDTGFYLDTYADIASARIDPLLHYIRHGRAEGRLAQPPRAARLAALQAARPAASHQAGYDAPADAPILDAGELASLLLRAMAPHAFAPHAFAGSGGPVGLLVAASHDRYIDVTGGIQLVLADEQRACAASGTTHLHLAPAVARLALADGTEPACLLQATIDGTFRGLVSAAAATAAIETVARAMPDRPRRLAIHSLLGHRTDTLAALAAACGPDAVFWLHDHSSLCEGFNLLRNDLDACHAPPPESMACRICVHGEGRALHRARIRALFDTVPFHVLAPSRVALDLWLARADLPFATASVAEPARLVPTGAEPRDAPATDPASPLRTAFLGYPLAHKGWPLFLDLVTALSLAEPGEPPCALHHLAVPEALRPMDRVATIPVQVGPAARQAAVEAIAAHAIEAVIVASPWPETFNFVAHEAAAAGAAVLTLADAGNVPAMVRRHGAGYVFETGAALLEFLLSGRAREEIRARKRPAPARLVPGRGSLARLEALLAEPPA
jgi:glycosyltransferase involved in cell wall biosynthesis